MSLQHTKITYAQADHEFTTARRCLTEKSEHLKKLVKVGHSQSTSPAAIDQAVEEL
jgi:hypothetical protein